MSERTDIIPSYLDQASLKQKYAFFQTLICLSGIDGKTADEEIAFIEEMAKKQGLDDMQLLPDFANKEEDVDGVKIINNRPQALELIYEMCNLAHVDNVLSDAEVMLIGEVGLAMGIEIEKIEQISNWVIDNIVLREQAKIIFEVEE